MYRRDWLIEILTILSKALRNYQYAQRDCLTALVTYFSFAQRIWPTGSRLTNWIYAQRD